MLLNTIVAATPSNDVPFLDLLIVTAFSYLPFYALFSVVWGAILAFMM